MSQQFRGLYSPEPAGIVSMNVSAGTTSNNLTGITFSNSNGLSFGLNAGVITGSYTVPAAGLSAVNVSAGTTSNNLTAITFSNSNGLAFGLNGSVITGSYTQAAAGITALNVSAGTTSNNLTQLSFANGSGVSFGLNGGTITATVATNYQSAGAYLTTAAQVSQVVNSINGSTGTFSFNTASSLSSSRVGNAITFGLASDITTALQSAGAYLTTAAQTSGPDSIWANFQNDADLGSGASAITQSSGSSMWIEPFHLDSPMSISFFRFLASFNDNGLGTAGTTSANTTFSCQRFTTFALGLYTNGVGASSRSLQYIGSSSVGMTGFTQYSAGNTGSLYTMTLIHTFPQSGFSTNLYTTSYAVSSGSIVLSSNSNTLFTGQRFLDIPFATSMSGGEYWLAFGVSTSSATNRANISFVGSLPFAISLNCINGSGVSWGALGAATSASDNQLIPGRGVWTTNASIFSTSSVALSQISNVASNPFLPFLVIRQA